MRDPDTDHDLVDAIIDASHDAIIFCDPGGTIVRWGEKAERLFGHAPSTAIGTTLISLFAGHLQSQVSSVLSRASAGGRIVGFDAEAVRSDGLPMPVLLSVSPVRATDTPPYPVVAAISDITEQRLAQATLAEVEVRLSESEALSHVGSWLWDARTDVVQWSAEFHRLHGVDPLEFDGTLEAYLAVLDAEDREELRSGVQRAVDTGRPFDIEYRVPGMGRLRIRAQPTIGSAGAVVGLRGVGRSADHEESPRERHRSGVEDRP